MSVGRGSPEDSRKTVEQHGLGLSAYQMHAFWLYAGSATPCFHSLGQKFLGGFKIVPNV